MTALRTEALSKRFGDIVAVDSLDMSVDDGEVYGFLGPNGAGKTTTIDVLLGYAHATSGDAYVLGEPAGDHRVHERVGVMPEGFGLYPRLTGREHVEFVAESKGVDANPDAVLERVGLGDSVEEEDPGDRRAGGYSKGMSKRLLLATALVGEPELLILDEPTSGLDPNGARRVREIVREENDRGATVFFSSHILGQVEAVCDRVGIMQEGELIAVDTVEGLRDGIDAVSRLSVVVDADETSLESAVNAVRGVEGVSDVSRDGDAVVVSCLRGDAKLGALDAVRQHVGVRDFTTDERSLDELFAAYTEPNDDAEEAETTEAGA
ncbi:MAG: ABC transporter ATP-binding protein [Halobacteriales archaeon]